MIVTNSSNNIQLTLEQILLSREQRQGIGRGLSGLVGSGSGGDRGEAKLEKTTYTSQPQRHGAQPPGKGRHHRYKSCACMCFS